MSVPQGFGYVGAALLSTVFLLVGQSQVVNSKRRRAGIKYPQVYADKAEEAASKDALIFNCAQRAHQNTLEYIAPIYVTTIISGLQYPVISASVCGLWAFSRIVYTRGYITGEPAKRVSFVYKIATAALIGNLLLSTYVAGGWVLQNITQSQS